VIFVPGNLTINPNIYKGSNVIDGCIFVVRGEVIITPGDDQIDPAICSTDPTSEECHPSYDLIEAYVMADGKMDIQEDTVGIVNDGLYVRGGLVAATSGSDTGLPAIQLKRSLRLLDNNKYPSLIVHSDMRYYYIAKELFGVERDTYKQDTGFK
jgi:hypothetical protein